MRQAAQLRRLIRTFKADLVHATLFDSCLVSRMATPWSVPLVNSLVSTSYARVRVERLGASPVKRGLVRAVDRLTIPRVTHVHALTQAVSDEARTRLGVPDDRITVIPRGRASEALGDRTDERRRAVREGLGLDELVPLVVNVGRQEPPKGQADLVRAFARLRTQHPDAVLLIAGRAGSASEELRSAIREMGVGDEVRLLGYRTDVADLVAASDLFAFPSVYEGLGSALIEAMGVGTPIVATDIPAIREVLAGGSAGRLVPPGDIPALAVALIELLGAPDERAAFALRGRERFLSTYTLDRVVDQTAAMYRRLMH